MPKAKREQCPVIYDGPSYPQFKGTQCVVNRHPHEGERHRATPNGRALVWLTAEEKAALGG